MSRSLIPFPALSHAARIVSRGCSYFFFTRAGRESKSSWLTGFPATTGTIVMPSWVILTVYPRVSARLFRSLRILFRSVTAFFVVLLVRNKILNDLNKRAETLGY